MFYMFAALSAMEPEKRQTFSRGALRVLAELRGETLLVYPDPPGPADFKLMTEPYRDGHDLPSLPDDWEEQAAVAVAVLAKSLVGQAPAKKVEPKARPPPD